MLTHPEIGSEEVKKGKSGQTTWKQKEPLEIVSDLNQVINEMLESTFMCESPDTIIMPIEQYTYLSTTGFSKNSDVTILNYFLKNQPRITTVEPVPQPFEQFAPESRAMTYIVHCHARCGGVVIPYPKSVEIRYGI